MIRHVTPKPSHVHAVVPSKLTLPMFVVRAHVHLGPPVHPIFVKTRPIRMEKKELLHRGGRTKFIKRRRSPREDQQHDATRGKDAVPLPQSLGAVSECIS